MYLSTNLAIYLSTNLAIYLSTNLAIYLSTNITIYLSIYLSIHPSIYLFIYLYIHLYIYQSKELSSSAHFNFILTAVLHRESFTHTNNQGQGIDILGIYTEDKFWDQLI